MVRHGEGVLEDLARVLLAWRSEVCKRVPIRLLVLLIGEVGIRLGRVVPERHRVLVVA